MKKRLLACVLVLVILALCGCQSTKEISPDARDIDYKFGNVPSVALSIIVEDENEDSLKWWDSFKKSFEEAYPDYMLTITPYDSKKLNDNIDTIVSSEYPPDLVISDAFKMYYDNEELIPIGDLIDMEVYKAPLVAFEKWDDEELSRYAIPAYTKSWGFAVNKGVLKRCGIEEFPKTWDELGALLDSINNLRNAPIPLGFSLKDEDGVMAFLAFIWGYGGDLIYDGESFDINIGENVSAIENESILIQSGYTNEDPINTPLDELWERFLNDEIAIVMTDSKHANGLDSDKYELYPFPSVSEDSQFSIADTKYFYGFDLESEDEESRIEALQAFFDMFYEKEAYESFIEVTGNAPITLNTIKNSQWCELLFKNKNMGMPIFRQPPIQKIGWDEMEESIILMQQNGLIEFDNRIYLY